MFRPVTELAESVRTGELRASELIDDCLSRIEALEPQLGAFTHIDAEGARRTAREIRPGDPRPFAGVPIAIKDNRPVAGLPLTNGSDLCGDYVADHDAHFVRRLRNAGFVIVGKTALPEMGILPTCEPRRGGATHNPWDLDRTPGGSSGGSAAAVAAGMVPIAHGNDGGGSLRIPAACCGLVGLKPSRGRVSSGPDAGDSFLVSDGVLTHTVAETASVLDILAGPELGDATWAPPPEEPFAVAAARTPERLRIAVCAVPPLLSADVDPESLRAVYEAAAQLESLGHEVEEIDSPWPSDELLPDFTRAFAPGVAMGVVTGGELAGREPAAEDVEPLTWALYERGRATSTLDHLAALDRLKGVARQIVARLDSYDALLTPALAQRGLPTGAVHGRGPDPMGNFRRSGVFTPFTAIFNVCGLPAISLPLLEGEDGFPTAVQLAGRPVGDGPLLALAAQLETALPWADRRPPLAAG